MRYLESATYKMMMGTATNFAFFGQQAEVHRKVNVGTLNSKPAEVNGIKPKSLRTSPEMPHRQQKSRARETPYSTLEVI